MRKLDNSRVEGFVKRHIFLKRWISVMLVVALLVTCTTMYALNKAASAVSEETADDVGMVLEGEDEEGTADNADANESQTSDDATPTEENSENDSAGEASSDEETEVADNTENTESEENTENADNTDENTASEESDTDTKENDQAEASTDNTVDNTDEENAAPETDSAEKAPEQTEDKAEADSEKAVLANTEDVELTEDVVLIVSYINEANEKIADEKEISLSDSLDFNTEAPKQEGYEFKQAAIDGTVITKIIAKRDANDHKYYEAVLANPESVSDGNAEDVTVVTIKENKTVVLTYKETEATKSEYVYENDKVRVVATLEKASAIPDDAQFVVTEVTADTTGYDYDAYMKALNNGEESTLANHNELNTILYDVAFMVDKKDEAGNVIEGEKVEYQPEEGSVSIRFEFLNKQLEDLSNMAEVADDDSEKTSNDAEGENKTETSIEVTHMPLNEEVKKNVDSTAEATNLEASDINPVTVEAQVNTEGEALVMSLDNFSIVSMSTMKLGADGTFIYDKDGRRLTYKQNSKTDAFTDSKYYNRNLALGIAGNFHVVAFENAEFTTHVNGNVLAKNFSTTADFGTRNIDDELSYIQNLKSFTETMASGEKHTLAIGNTPNVGISDESYFEINGKKVSKPFNIIQDKNTAQNPYIDLNKVKESIKAISDGLAHTTDGAVVHSENKDNNSFHTFTYLGDGGAGYLNLKGSEWNRIVEGKAIEFVFPQKHANQAIIINIDCSDVNEIKWPTKASDVYVNKTALKRGETPDVNDGRIVYNFVNADGKNIYAKEVFGQILAIGANLEVDKGDGNFVATNVKITGETHRRDFIGTTTKSGAIVFTGTKTVDGGTVPSEFANGKFEFQVDKYDGQKGWVKIGTTYNEGNEIKFDVTNAITGEGKYYIRIHEVIPENESDRVSGMTYDTRYYLADIDVISTTENTQYGTNIKYSVKNITYHVADTQNIQWSDKNVKNIAFENKTAPKTGMLRIHKMVVNDYGSKFVRDATGGAALLDKVTFRITNNDTKNYIVVTGFTGTAGHSKIALEYDSKTHQPNGNEYKVTYNQSAQWTIEGLALGTYTVEEVADGYTFSYDASSNTSSAIEVNNLSRVTKYDVTVDSEESNNGRKSPLYGTGGNNYRAVFSKDIPNKVDLGPTNVVVGDTTQTVQVCNYYSIPIGPIQVSKNFSGGDWNDNMAFTFKIEPTGYSAHVSEGGAVTLKSQPMPLDKDGNVADTVTLTGADATKNSDGTYSAIAKFASIPFRYEGTYYYKITELDTGIDGVQYDLNKVYYVKVEVSKKYTTFRKTYTYEHMTHPAKYTADTTLDEDFFYLGADVVYSDVQDFSNVLATCELKLGTNPDTTKPENNVFIVDYKNGTSVYNTIFRNTLKGNLTVKKVWKSVDGSDDNQKHEQALTITILQRLEKGSSGWKTYATVQLSPENNWSQTITDLPIMDENGVKYKYCVKETDDFLTTFDVTYTYNGKSYNENSQTKTIKVDGSKVLDPGFEMKVGSDGKNYGEVVITNMAVVVNTLPSAGGMGTLPFTIGGLLIAISALAIFAIYRKKHLV